MMLLSEVNNYALSIEGHILAFEDDARIEFFLTQLFKYTVNRYKLYNAIKDSTIEFSTSQDNPDESYIFNKGLYKLTEMFGDIYEGQFQKEKR